MSSSGSEIGTRVWVKDSAIESVQNPRSFKEKMARKASNLSASGTTSSSLHSSFSRQCSFNSNVGGGGGGSSVASSANREFDNESDIGSVGNNSGNYQSRRNGGWGWKAAYLTDSSRSGITISLESVTPETSTTPFTLPSTAMSDGDIFMANDHPLSSEGTPICPNDLISLTHLHEPAVVECLHHRYEEDQIYTSTGPVLLALNPFQNIRGMYGETTMKKYWEKAEKNAKGNLPPHVYAIADSAFRSMMRRLDETLGEATPVGCDQSILVSGESGAGKTVTTKFVMKYLAALSQRAGNIPPEKRAFQMVAEKRQFTPSGSWGSRDDDDRGLSAVTNLTGAGATNSIEAQVLQSNPILESFGNARTVRNDNSSRFGKFIEIQFTRMGRLVGAQIDVYLLEKVRLVTQSLGERNYHIFYEILSGAMTSQELRNYFIASTATAEDFKITASGTYDRRDGVSDKETYRALRTAMNAMKFPQEEQRDILSTAAAILHASNLSFIAADEGSALDEHNVHLQPVCHLFGVSAEDLSRALCSFSITAGKNTHVQRSLTVEGAIKGLEALLKTTYGALFTYLVSRINDSISFRRDYESDEEDISAEESMVSDNPVACIGVLDIFGFESFKTNSFEQLCINYCNEALQQQFNSFVLKNEQAEYDREGIEWSFIDFPENQDVLDLIDKRGSGILCILDDQCRAPGTSDKSFALDVYNKCKNQSRFSASRKQTAVLQFCVNHYAGPVEYSTGGFIEKNRDELPKEATELLQNSFNPFIRILAEIIENNGVERAASTTDTPQRKFRRQDSAMARITVGGQFRKQLRHLRDKIDKMSPHYVRCLKPNDDLIPDHFDRAAVVEQLRCGGILEAVRVARAGYSNHYPHSEFVRRYRCLGWKELSLKETGATYSNAGSFGGINKPPNNNNNRKGPRAVGAFRSHNSYTHTPTGSSSSRTSNQETSCKDLVKILFRKLQQEKDDNTENENSLNGSEQRTQEIVPSTPPAQAKKYSYQVSTPPPSWSKQSGRTPGLPPAPMTAPVKKNTLRSSSAAAWEKRISDARPPSSPALPPRTSISKRWGGGTTSDWAKVGIQIGKTKVFLRRTAFETLERLRTKEQSAAAVKLNSVFRMYLARLAYVHVRDRVRHSMHHLQLFESDYKESKEQEYDDEYAYEENYFRKLRNSFGSSSYMGEMPSLVEVWATQIRSGIHNPVPRDQWGKEFQEKPFKWTLLEGLWVKNHDFSE